MLNKPILTTYRFACDRIASRVYRAVAFDLVSAQHGRYGGRRGGDGVLGAHARNVSCHARAEAALCARHRPSPRLSPVLCARRLLHQRALAAAARRDWGLGVGAGHFHSALFPTATSGPAGITGSAPVVVEPFPQSPLWTESGARSRGRSAVSFPTPSLLA